MKKILLCSVLACMQLAFIPAAGKTPVRLNSNAREAEADVVLPLANGMGSLKIEPLQTSVRTLEAEGDEAENDEEDTWLPWGTGYMSDFLISQYFDLEGDIFEVTFEKSATDPDKFRIVNPYENWTPNEELKGKVQYNKDNATPIVFHYVQNKKRAYFEDFDSGVEILVAPDPEGTYKWTGEAIGYPEIWNLLKYNGMSKLDMLLEMAPEFFCRNFNGNFTLPAQAHFGSTVTSTISIAVDQGEETLDGYTAWFFPANRDGSFLIVLPDFEDDSANWTDIGEGYYTDVILSSLFSGIEPESLKVKFQQNIEDENTYRILAPYANWKNELIGRYFTYNEMRATPMVFHVVGDNNEYAWFEEFDTGLYMNYNEGGTQMLGEITMLHQAESFILQYGETSAVDLYPSMLCKNDDGNLTLDAFSFLMNNTIYNILFKIGSASTYRGNIYGDFLVTLPGAGEPDPNKGWESLGNVHFRDGFTDVFAALSRVNPTEDQYQTLSVELQRNIVDPSIYRLVNPYAGWKNVYGDMVTYDSSRNYYMNIYVVEDENKAAVGNFYTGLTYEGMGAFGVYTNAGAGLQENGAYYMYDSYPEMFGDIVDGVFKCPVSYKSENKVMYSFSGWFGYLTSNPNFYRIDRTNQFFIAFPESGVGAVEVEEDGAVEYFSLQGVRLAAPEPGQIVIRKHGSKVSKTIAR